MKHYIYTVALFYTQGVECHSTPNQPNKPAQVSYIPPPNPAHPPTCPASMSCEHEPRARGARERRVRVVPDRWRAGSGGASGGGGCDGAWVAAAGAEVATARGGGCGQRLRAAGSVGGVRVGQRQSASKGQAGSTMQRLRDSGGEQTAHVAWCNALGSGNCASWHLISNAYCVQRSAKFLSHSVISLPNT